jgi:hypothetical protein
MVIEIIIVVLLLLIFVAGLLYYKSGDIYRYYRAEVSKRLADSVASVNAPLTGEDIAHLPAPVKNYLKYTGVIGREKVRNFRIAFEGEMKLDPKRDWIKVKTEQYNFFDTPARFFLIRTVFMGLPVIGLHSYTDEMARMLIKVLGLATVLDSHGPEMRVSDTITLFNDMCLMAPATLIDRRVQWEPVDQLTVKATYENLGCTITATLYFNDKGELVNFISDDRYMIGLDNVPRKARWATPVTNYRDFGGVKLGATAEVTWLLAEGDYCYGRLTMKEVEYNSKAFR